MTHRSTCLTIVLFLSLTLAVAAGESAATRMREHVRTTLKRGDDVLAMPPGSRWAMPAKVSRISDTQVRLSVAGQYLDVQWDEMSDADAYLFARNLVGPDSPAELIHAYLYLARKHGHLRPRLFDENAERNRLNRLLQALEASAPELARSLPVAQEESPEGSAASDTPPPAQSAPARPAPKAPAPVVDEMDDIDMLLDDFAPPPEGEAKAVAATPPPAAQPPAAEEPAPAPAGTTTAEPDDTIGMTAPRAERDPNAPRGGLLDMLETDAAQDDNPAGTLIDDFEKPAAADAPPPPDSTPPADDAPAVATAKDSPVDEDLATAGQDEDEDFDDAPPAADAEEEFVGPFDSWARADRDFKAKGNGRSDDTKELQAAFDSLQGRKGVLYLPKGTYRITDTLRMNNHREFAVIGRDPENTIILWDGPEGGTMFESNALRECRFERLTWDGNNKAGVIIQHAWDGKTGNGSTGKQHVDMVFKNADYGIRAGIKGLMVSETAVRRCRFQNLKKAGVTLDTGNVLNWWFRHCIFEKCGKGIQANFGEFFVRDCFFTKQSDADLVITQSCIFAARDNVSIDSKAFLATRGGAGHWAHVVLQNNRVVASDRDATPVQFHLSAPFLMIGNEFEVKLGPAAKGNFAYNAVAIANRYENNGMPVSVKGDLLKVGEEPGKKLKIRPPAMPATPQRVKRKIFEVGPGSSSAAIQSVINRAADSGRTRAVVHFPAGHYKINRTIEIPSRSDIQLVGDGHATHLQSFGADPVILFKGPTQAAVSHLSINAGNQRGVVIEDGDENGGHVFMDRCTFGHNEQHALLVEGIEKEVLDLHACQFMYTKSGAAIRVAGDGATDAPDEEKSSRRKRKKKRKSDDSGVGGQVRLWQGNFGWARPVFEVENGGWLLAQDSWGENPYSIYFRGIGEGTFYCQGMRWAVYKDDRWEGTGNPGKAAPIVDVDRFNGTAVMSSIMATTPVEKHFDIKGDMPERNLLFLANMSEGGNYFVNNSKKGKAALVSCNGFQAHCQPVPNQGYNPREDQDWLLDMLRPQTEARPIPPGQAPKSANDIRCIGLYVMHSRIGLTVKP